MHKINRLSFIFGLASFLTSTVVSISAVAESGSMPIIISSPSKIIFDKNASTTAGTPQMSGVSTKLLYGDTSKAGLSTVIVRIAPHTRFQPLTHPNDGFVTVLSGRWYLGFGTSFDKSKLSTLKAGDFYTEPANEYHFAETRNEPVIMAVTTYDPSGLIEKK